MQPKFSVLIPAFNEEKYLPRTIASIREAENALGEPVEIVIADNGSTDRTAALARELGAVVTPVEIRRIATVRNRAAAKATGKYFVFIDADDVMSPNMLTEIDAIMSSGKYIGGGVRTTRYERNTLGIRLTQFLVTANLRLMGLSMFLFYTTAEAFRELGGFDENLYINEDTDFAIRLKKLGKRKGLRYYNMTSAVLTKSSRKFDEYGDWFTFRRPLTIVKVLLKDHDAIYELWYRPRR